MGVVAALARSEPALLEMKPAARPLRWLWAGIGVLILLTPIGALAPGTAWGEWGSKELKAAMGYAPANLERFGGLWRSAMPGYATPGISNALLGYLIAAVVGTALTVGVAFALGALLARRGEAQPPEAPSATRHGGGGGRSLARKTADSIAGAVTEVLQNEELAARPGLLQRLDPRIKLLTLVLVALIGATIVLAAASRVGVGSFERKVWASAGLLAFLLAAPSAMQIFTPGPVVVPLGPFSLTEPGLMGAATLVTRVVAAAGFALLVVWTMRWSDLLKALSAMRLPDVVVATLAMTHKQILTLLRTVQQIHLARESRTLTRGSARADRVWVTERMAFVVRKSMKTADDVYDAMLSRGFTGAMPSLVRLRLRPRDWAWSVASVALCAAILYVDRVVGPR
jgi:energy-coupling factor transporter transmembrane protein EcfT